MGQKPKFAGKRISLCGFMEEFDTEEKTMEYLESRRWNGDPRCPRYKELTA